MIYKYEAGMSLNKINWDAGVENEIFMGNVPEQTGYNSEMQRIAGQESMDFRTIEPYCP